MSALVRFEDEADAEYRAGGLWYEGRQAGLGVQFFDEVDAAIRRILEFPGIGLRVHGLPKDLPVPAGTGPQVPVPRCLFGTGD